MANRRMFSKRITNSARFLKMPPSTQCLYFHLGLNADDDGVVEAYAVMNSMGASEDDLRVLVAKGFVYILNEDLVTYITDWQENNKIRADRKVDSIYKELLLQMLPDVQLLQKKPRSDTKNGTLDGHWTDTGQSMDNQRTAQDRLGKDRLGKDRLDIHTAKAVRTDYQHFVDLYNSHCSSLPQVKTLNEKRKRLIKKVAREVSEDDLITALNKANTNPFLRGDNGGWKANFDWLMNPDNITKVLEGNYDRGKTQNSTNKDYDTDFGIVIEV